VCTYHLFDDKHHPFPPLATEAVARGEAGKGAAIRRNMRRVRKGEAS